MKVKTQFLLIPFLTAFLVGYVALTFFAVQGSQAIKLSNLYESHLNVADTLEAYRTDLIRLHLSLFSTLTSNQSAPDQQEQLRSEVAEIESRIIQIENIRKQIIFTPQETVALERISQEFGYYLRATSELIQNVPITDASSDPETLANANQSFQLATLNLSNFLTTRRENSIEQLFQIQDKADEELSRLGTLLLLTIAFIVISCWIVSRQLQGSIGKLVSTLGELSQGNTRIEVPQTTANNEFRDIFSAVENFRNTQIKYQHSRQALDSRSRELERLLSTIPGMAYRCEKDERRNLLMASAGCLDLTGYRAEELTESKLISYAELIHPDDLPRILDQIEDATLNQHTFQLTYRLIDRNQETRWVLDRGMEVFDDDTNLGTLEGLVIDISERKQAEEQARKLNSQLEHRVEERTQDLQQTIQQMTELQNQLIESEKQASLGSLVSGVALEINTPIGICVTATSHLEIEVNKLLRKIESEQLRRSELVQFVALFNEGLQLIQSNVRTAAGLVNSFKLMAADRDNEELRSFYLNEYLGELINGINPRLHTQGHSISLNCPDNLMLHSYPGAFYQIITKLVDNSVEHGFAHTANGHINIEVEASDGLLRVIYTDNGIGVGDNVKKHIFEPFYSAGEKRKQGLGLNIVYNTVTQMLQGQIHCSSEPGQGICFEIEAPIDAVSKANSQ
ncbi:sensor histidine kinase [Aestuariirhabdus haliotis]|uniref:sensor histidine kinase n=1 Tax=Aestuariirhabdus haliotis TaxID=2918751 RepID=UPI0020BD5BFE|nr:PAS domain-containing sensor histidine kinase [Aestuariirhabdus haliotis]MCL6421086.1 PAS domain-containing sensor histidine kinase [Aestuariirhabdus haliotis]